GNLGGAVRLFVGCRADFLGKLVHLSYDIGNLLESRIQFTTEFQAFVDDSRAAVHVLDRLAGFLLNALNELGDFLGRLRRFFGQLANLVGYYGKSQPVLTGARCFDGSVQGQQVRLLGQVIDHLDDLADVVRALPEHIYDLPRTMNRGVDAVQAIGSLLHGRNAVVDFFSRAVGNVEQHLGGVGDPLNRSDHLLNRTRSLAPLGSLCLCALDHVLDIDAHLMHRAGDFVDGGRGLQADLGGFIGCSSHLPGSASHLCRGIAHVFHQAAQAFHHFLERVAQGVAVGPGLNFDCQIAPGNRLGKSGHLFQVLHHGVESSCQFANLVLPLDIDVVVEITSLANPLGDSHQIVERFSNGLGGGIGNE